MPAFSQGPLSQPFRGLPLIPVHALALAIFLLTVTKFAASEEKASSYLLRMARETRQGTACLLLQDTGAFHFELTDGDDDTRVFEGELSPMQLETTLANMHALYGISQSQIEEPLLPGSPDLLDVRFLQDGEVRELVFQSSQSQQPYSPQLQPLLRWMDRLRRLPHRELSEDVGKHNCLPRRNLVLKRREGVAFQSSRRHTQIAGPSSASPQPPAAATMQPQTPLLFRSELFQETSSNAAQLRCALVSSDGRYRFEYREQKGDRRKIANRIARGKVAPGELVSLQKLLDARPLASIRHRKPPDGMELYVSGSVLELLIHRSAGVQDLILTDSKYRNNFFYAGDADISGAGELLRFVKEHLEINASPAQSISELNGCSALP